MAMNLVTGTIGILLLVGFLGFMLIWVKAVPLIVIVVGTVALLVHDFRGELSALRRTNGDESRQPPP